MLDADTMSQQNIFSYSIEEYKKLSDALKDSEKENNDFQELKNKVSKSTKPLSEYIKALVDLIENHNNDSAIKSLMDKAFKHQKYDYAICFAEACLAFNEQNFYAMDMKAICLKKIDAPIEIQKEAIKSYLDQDLNDTHYLFELSEIHLKEGKDANAVIDLKKALQRAVKKKDYQELKIGAIKLDSILKKNDKFYIIPTLSRAIKNIGVEKINSIFAELEKRNHDDCDFSIELLKEILKTDPKNSKARSALVEQYKLKYNNSERTEECLQSSGLLMENQTKILVSIEKFEKLVELDIGTFVYHATYGLGRIKNVDGSYVFINFLTKMNHKMSIDMALKSLSILFKNHIWVLKAFANQEKLHNKFIEDPKWGLYTLIKSGDNSLKLMKNELVPSVLNNDEFRKFSLQSKEIIKNDSFISSVLNKNDEFEVREIPMTYEEKQYRVFKNENNIYSKMKVVRDFLQTEGDQTSESFQEMIDYFSRFLNQKEISNNYIISHFFLNELHNGKFKIESTSSHLKINNQELFMSIPENELINIYAEIQDGEIRKDFIDMIKSYDKNWDNNLSAIFIKYPSVYISNIFKKKGDANFDKKMMKKSIHLIKQSPELFLYYYKNESDYSTWKNICQNEQEFIIAQLDALNSFAKTPYIKTITANLLDNKYLYNYIEKINESDFGMLSTLYYQIEKNSGIDEMTKARLKHTIISKDPSILKDTKQEGDTDNIPKGLLCLKHTFDLKKKEYNHLINVEIPKNAEELAQARSLGDLRENSEYQYAKDKQKILNATMKNLENEISQAVIMDLSDVNPSVVTFGCNVFIEHEDGKKENYKILGPWESNADENIISFSSPLGRKLYNKTKGDRLNFSLNDVNYDFKVMDIKVIQ